MRLYKQLISTCCMPSSKCIEVTFLLVTAATVVEAQIVRSGGLAMAEARALPAVQTNLTATPSAPIESAPSATPHIVAPGVATPAIESPSAEKTTISRPPVGAAPLDVRPSVDPNVQRELQRLQRVAETRRGFGTSAASAQAAWLLGLIYLHGAGVRRDLPLAHTWFDRAARFGREPWAYAGQAWCAIEGCEGPADPELARRAIEQLSKKYPARAAFLEWVLLARATPLQVSRSGVVQTEVLQLPHASLLEKAASQGDMHALIELGLNAVSNDRLPEALEYFRRAGARSQAAQANIRQIQSRIDANRSSKPVNANDASIAELLAAARKYHRGTGVPVNYVEAVRLYRLADAKGSLEARRMLNLIFSRPSPTGGVNVGWMQQLAYADPMTTIPTVGVPSTADLLYRDPTPLYDLLPEFWRQQITQVGR